ncbi:O-antigen ligase family protein [Nocardioides conyzicola]|uniref:O-antigen ligase family protein n=1 Tax=Nocardioides conyzicola TaxID=1651781 RepID=A0ABP8XHT1_9ACTN
MLAVMAPALLALAAAVAFAGARRWSIVVAVVAALGTSQLWQVGITARPEVFVCVILLCSSALRPPLAAAPVANRNILTLLGFWLAYATAVSLAFSPRPADSISLIIWSALSMSALWWLPRLGLTAREVVCFGTAVVLAHALFAIGAWLLAQTGSANYFVFLDFGDTNYRARGITLEPNILGSTSVAWITVVYYWRHVVPRWVLLSTVPIAAAGLTSLTRTTIACLLLVGAIIALRNFGSFVRGAVLAAVSIPVLLSVAGSSVLAAQGRAASLLDFNDFSQGTGAFRSRSWQLALDDLSNGTGWLTGFGINSFPQRYEAYVNHKSLDYLSNFWITTLYDTGVVGAFLLVLALVAIVRAVPRKYDALPFFIGFAISQSVTSTSWLLFTWFTVAAMLLPNAVEAQDSSPKGRVDPVDGSIPGAPPRPSITPVPAARRALGRHH